MKWRGILFKFTEQNQFVSIIIFLDLHDAFQAENPDILRILSDELLFTESFVYCDDNHDGMVIMEELISCEEHFLKGEVLF